MAFEKINFSPVGNNARAGNVPQVFTYVSADTIAVISANGYFNELKGYLRRGDWIELTSSTGGTFAQSIHFVTGDGQSPAIYHADVVAGGASYSIGDTVVVTVAGSGVIQKPVLKVLTVSTGAIATFSIIDPGLFDPTNMPTDFTALASTTTDGGSGATFDIFPSQSSGGILTADEGSAAGTGYAVGDTLSITFSNGTVNKAPIAKVATLSGSAIATLTVDDPGSFDPTDPPTTLTNLATVTLTGSGTGANADVTVTDVVLGTASAGYLADITLSDLDFTAV